MNIFIDLDGTIVRTEGTGYENAKPIPERIKKVNQLYDEGHFIVIYTARGSGTHFNWTKLTERQLKEWGVRYHQLQIGEKPVFDLLIDDRALNASVLDNDNPLEGVKKCQ